MRRGWRLVLWGDEGWEPAAAVSVLTHAIALLALIVFLTPPERIPSWLPVSALRGKGSVHHRGIGHGAELLPEHIQYIQLARASLVHPMVFQAATASIGRNSSFAAPQRTDPRVPSISADSASIGVAAVGFGIGGAGGDGTVRSGAGNTHLPSDTLTIPITIIGGGRHRDRAPMPLGRVELPRPIPSSMLGFRLFADFDVDETGRVTALQLNEVPDRDYSARLHAVLERMKFQPGLRADSAPVPVPAPMRVRLTIDIW